MTHSQKKLIKQTEIAMDTLVTIRVVSSASEKHINECLVRAFAVFRYVEAICSRFTPDSEVMHLTQQVGKRVPVSPVLFEALNFALEVSKVTDGDFDPTIGHRLETLGFNKHYLTGYPSNTPVDKTDQPVSYKDVELDSKNRTVLLHLPMVIDLGAVVKGLAIDLAAKELQEFEGFSIDAGGDLYLKGINLENQPWKVGIEHPLQSNELIGTLEILEGAICTSAPFKRLSTEKRGESHLIQPKTGTSPRELLSTTVVAPFAMLADTFSTAVFVKGAEKGYELLEQEDLDGILVTPDFKLKTTKGMSQYEFTPNSFNL